MRIDRTRGGTCAALISLAALLAGIPSVGFGQSSTVPASTAPAAQDAAAPPSAGAAAQSALPTLPFIVFDGGGNVAQVPFEFSGSEILMPIHVNRTQPSLFIVDSREKPSAIDSEYAAELHLIDAPPAPGSSDATLPKPVLRMPGLQLVPRSLELTSLRGISAQQGRPINGMVGTDILNLFVVEPRFRLRTSIIFRPLKPRQRFPAEITNRLF
jgi:hypothetical protein